MTSAALALRPASGDVLARPHPQRRLDLRRSLLLVPPAAAFLLASIQLAFPGALTGVTEYDDGVYLGQAMRLVGGALPYRDFVAVNPPGIDILLAPFGVLAKLIGSDVALAAARVATALVAVANVALLGRILRPRGWGAQMAGMTLLAVFPAEALAAHTVLLEPYLNLLCLLAVSALFQQGRELDRRALLSGGFLFGVACTVKLFAVFPVVALVILLLRRNRRGLPTFIFAVTAGSAVVSVPFLLAAPDRFVHQAILDQVLRTSGSRTPLWERLPYLDGTVALPGVGDHPGVAIITGAVVLAVVVVLIAARRRGRHGADPMAAFSTLAVTCVGLSMLWTGTFYYHYAAAMAPWLALLVALHLPRARLLPPTRVLLGLVAALGLALDILAMPVPATPAAPLTAEVDQIIPADSCVVADSSSYTEVAGRFVNEPPGCPDVVDSFGTTMALSGGVPADALERRQATQVVGAWESTFSHADYLILSSGVGGSIPMTPQLRAFLAAHFTLKRVLSDNAGTVYRADRPDSGSSS